MAKIPHFTDLAIRHHHIRQEYDGTIYAHPGYPNRRFSILNTSGLKLRADPRMKGNLVLAYFAPQMYALLQANFPNHDLLTLIEKEYQDGGKTV
jgi:hypothetical protein